MTSNVILFMKSILVAFLLLATGECFSFSNEIESKLDALSSNLGRDSIKSQKVISDLNLQFDFMTNDEKSRFYLLKGVLAIYSSEHYEALKLLNLSEALTEKRGRLSRIEGLKLTSYLAVKKYKEALESGKKQLSKIKFSEGKNIKIDAYLRLVNLFYNLKDFDSMLKYNKELESMISGSENLNNNCANKLYQSLYLIEKSKPETAKKMLLETLTFCKENNFFVIETITLRALGDLSLRNNELNDAVNYFNKALKNYHEIDFKQEVTHVHSFLSKSYHKLKKFSIAESYANRVIDQSDDFSIYEAKHIAHQTLSKIYHTQGNYKLAYEHGQKEHFYQDWLYDDNKMKALAVEAAKFNFAEMERLLLLKEKPVYGGLLREDAIVAESNARETQRFLWQSAAILITTFFISALSAIQFLLDRMRFDKNSEVGVLRLDYMNYAARELMYKMRFTGEPYGVIAFNLDSLPAINETFNHTRGEIAIECVIAAIRKTLKGQKNVQIGRHSDTLFYVYVTHLLTDELVKYCQNALEAIHNFTEDDLASNYRMRVTFGVGVITDCEEAFSTAEVLQKADLALNKAQELGGDNVVGYDDSLAIEEEEAHPRRQARFVHFIDPKLMGSRRKLL